MKREEVVKIVSTLKYTDDDYDDNYSNFILEFLDRRYEVTFKRLNGIFKSFTIEDTGEVKK